jgi:hypothetical protein
MNERGRHGKPEAGSLIRFCTAVLTFSTSVIKGMKIWKTDDCLHSIEVCAAFKKKIFNP